MAKNHGLISTESARALGLTASDVRELLRTHQWRRLRRGVYVDAQEWESADEFVGRPLLRVRAAALHLPAELAFSHDSAALVHGLPVPDARISLVHVSGAARGCERGGIKYHQARFTSDSVISWQRVKILPPQRTAVDLAREHGLTAGVAACDHLMRHGVSRAELRAQLVQMHRWPGIRTAQRAVALADPGSESYLESAARLLVIELGFGVPETQFGLSDGVRAAWCDLRIGRHLFEVDGKSKYVDRPNALWNEKLRQDFLGGFKLGFSRINARDVYTDRRAAKARLTREFLDTARRFGTDTADLEPYRVPRRLRSS